MLNSIPRAAALALTALIWVGTAQSSRASDHLDTPSVITNPQADIGDLYAWTSHTGRQLNLVMTIVGRSFSDRIKYTFHLDSGTRFGQTTATTLIECRFPARDRTECSVGAADSAAGDASRPEGLYGRHHRFRVFAGTRDDPFFNNVKGTRAAYQVAATALHNGAVSDAAGCPGFDPATSEAIFDQWRHTGGGPASNFLAGWTSSALVISVDLPLVTSGGRILAVWATTSVGSKQIDRAARPLTGNALLGTLASEEVSNRLKEEYNAATPRTSGRFVPEIEQALALYDAFDGKCGNQLLARGDAPSPGRYRALAQMLADDRLWVNTESTLCLQLFAVELTALAGQRERVIDCGGRTPLYNAANVYRSLLVDGTTASVDDGVDRDDETHSETEFPFLAAPGGPGGSSAPDAPRAPGAPGASGGSGAPRGPRAPDAPDAPGAPRAPGAPGAP
jgi:Domain of unknown function (DUF4331)